MKFECGDLDRALASSELMPEAREHLKHCAACRREYRVWTGLSGTAKTLHEEWDTPALWQSIRQKLKAEPKLKTKPVWWREWKTWAVAAMFLIGAVLLIMRPWEQAVQTGNDAAHAGLTSANRDFLTDQALQEVEKNEAAYRQSIDKLSQL
ncbi:MAG: hypothetical protein WB992_07160, partial [Bryobacteraceae bacterium]